jgi:hypothetical protein
LFAGILRWLGVAADFAAGVFGGSPIGITTDIASAPPSSGESASTEEPSDEGDDRAT